MTTELSGRTALVTGGNSGIGRATAVALAALGAKVVLSGRDAARGEQTVRQIEEAGGTAFFVPAELSDQASARALATRAAELAGPVDVLVNSAGVAHVGTVETTTEEDLDRLYAVNVKGVYHCLQAAVAAMKGRGGAILNVASVAAVVGIPDRFAYSMTKGAVLTMTYSVARDYVDQQIRCNCISPARVHTPFVDGFLARSYPGREPEMFEKLSRSQPIGRMGRPDEIAELALFLCSDAAAFITGSNYAIDGGFVTLKM